MLDSIGIFHADAQEIYGQLAGSERPTAHLANAADEPGRRKATECRRNSVSFVTSGCLRGLTIKHMHAKRSGNELKRRSRNAEEILKHR